MTCQRLFFRWATAGLGVAAFAAVLSAAVHCAAQDAAGDGSRRDKPDGSIREQDIYIPYTKLREVFEKQGRGVFLPYEQFQELWRAAREKTQPAAQPKPPAGGLITDIASEATVEKDVVRVKATLRIELLTEGWHSIPLRLADAGVIAATLAGKPARIVGDSAEGYRLLLEKKGKEAETVELRLEYAKAIARLPGMNSVSFEAPQSPVSRWRIAVPQAGVKVNLRPLIAATEVPPENKPQRDGKSPAETVVLAFVGAAPVVRIDWTPKAEGATGMAALASVQAQQQVWIGEGVLRTRAVLGYAISRAELPQLSIDVPADQKIINVFDANVRGWSVKAAEGKQRITADLFEPAKASQQVIVELERFLPGQAKGELTVPVLSAVGVGRQQGTVMVALPESLRAEVAKSTGLMQEEAGAAGSPGYRGANWAFVYRYATVPFELTLAVEKVQPRITVDSLVEARLQPERLTVDLTAVYTIEKAGVFTLDWAIPPGYEDFEVRQVRGVQVVGATPVEVDNFHTESGPATTPLQGVPPGGPATTSLQGVPPGGKPTRLIVNLSRKAIGRVALFVQFQKELHASALLAPADKPAQVKVLVPTVPPGSAQRATGRVVVDAPESLRVNPERLTGLRSVSFVEAFEGIQSPGPALPGEPRPVLAYAYAAPPVELTLSAERRKPETTVRQLLVARIEDGVVKYQSTLFYNVLYSGVKSLRLDVPAEVASGLHVDTAGVRESVISPPPKDLGPGDAAWSLAGETEFLGEGRIELKWEKKIDKLGVGKSVELPVPYLKPRDVFRSWGQIVLVKSETIDVQPAGEPKSLRMIDPEHDLIAAVPSAASAFEFHDDWSLSIVATRYQLEDVPRTSIERAFVRMVVAQDKTTSVQASYRMRSEGQRLTVRLPAGRQFDAQPLRINGRQVGLETADAAETYYVPLSAVKGEKPFLLELRYTLPEGRASDGLRFELPEFVGQHESSRQTAEDERPAALKAYLCVYLPKTRVLLGARGPWTQEFGLRWDGNSWRWRPSTADSSYGGRRFPSPAELVEWVREGVEAPGNPADDFQTDGVAYVYSTLRPAAPPASSLELTAVDDNWLKGAVFAVVAVLGVLLLPARLPLRALVVGAMIVALVLSGALLPIFAAQVLNGVFLAAVFVVAVLWTVAFLATRRRPSAAGPSPGSPEPGVDLSQYQPEPPLAEPPAAEPPPGPAKPEDGQPPRSEGGQSEGGQSHA